MAALYASLFGVALGKNASVKVCRRLLVEAEDIEVYVRYAGDGSKMHQYTKSSRGNVTMSISIIASFQAQQLLEETSASRDLSGLAMLARHDFIEARAQARAEHILRLLVAGKEAEARYMVDHAG